MIDGDWVGGFEANGTFRFMIAHFKTDGADIKATIDIPFERLTNMELVYVKLQPPRVHLELQNVTTKLVFDGELGEEIISGNCKHDNIASKFQLVHIVTIDPKVYPKYLNTFEVKPSQLVTLSRFGTEDIFCYFEPHSGKIRQLFPLSNDAFFSGPKMFIPVPIEQKFILVKDKEGEVTSLKISRKGTKYRTARKVRLNRKRVTFKNGEVKLSGTLILPLTKGSHPAIVMVHGSGSEPRDFTPFHDSFALSGIAALIYDKRGVGESSGDWRKSSFDDLAEDALAGVRFLESRDDIDSKQIGLWGISQGGWICALAAASSKDVAYVVSVSGPAVTPAQQEKFRVEHEMRADGFSEEDISEALTLMEYAYNFARTGDGWAKYEKAREKALEKNWGSRYIWGSPSKDDWSWRFWRLIQDYDPMPVLKKVTCPVLAIFGELDQNVIPAVNVPLWEKALKKARNNDYTIKVFPKSNHVILISKTGGPKELRTSDRFHPDFLKTMINWILKRVKLAK